MFLVLIIIGVFIACPFFAIDYFDLAAVHKVAFRYALIPMVIISFTTAVLLYWKYLRKFNPPTNSRAKTIAQHILIPVFSFIFLAGMLYGLVLSFVITSNAYYGKQQTVDIKAEVLDYRTNTSRGVERKYITFKNPVDSSLVTMRVFKKYQPGEMFVKQMKIGGWGLLYSIN